MTDCERPAPYPSWKGWQQEPRPTPKPFAGCGGVVGKILFGPIRSGITCSLPSPPFHSLSLTLSAPTARAKMSWRCYWMRWGLYSLWHGKESAGIPFFLFYVYLLSYAKGRHQTVKNGTSARGPWDLRLRRGNRGKKAAKLKKESQIWI